MAVLKAFRSFPLMTVALMGLLAVLLALSLSARGGAVPSVEVSNPFGSSASSASRARAWDVYGNLPLSFEANRGQTDSRVDFLARGSDYGLLDRKSVV